MGQVDRYSNYLSVDYSKDHWHAGIEMQLERLSRAGRSRRVCRYGLDRFDSTVG